MKSRVPMALQQAASTALYFTALCTLYHSTTYSTRRHRGKYSTKYSTMQRKVEMQCTVQCKAQCKVLYKVQSGQAWPGPGIVCLTGGALSGQGRATMQSTMIV